MNRYSCVVNGAFALAMVIVPGTLHAAGDRGPIAWAVAGSPISVTPAGGRDVISSVKAARIAARAIGSVHEARRYHVWFSDASYSQSPLTHVRAWLLTYRAIPAGIVSPKAVAGRRFYVVIDARAGTFLEAFTEPLSPWWKLQSYRRVVKHDSFFVGMQCRRNTGRPLEPLSRLFNSYYVHLDRGQQFFRYMSLTEPNVLSPHSPIPKQVTPPIIGRPVWVVVAEASPQFAPGGPPPDHEARRTWNRLVEVIDARSGNMLESGGEGATALPSELPRE